MPLSAPQRRPSAAHASVVRSPARRRAQAHRGHDHHHHAHDHHHGRPHDHTYADRRHEDRTRHVHDSGVIVVIRPASGLSGDMLLAGLACMAEVESKELGAIARSIGLPEDCVSLERRAINDVGGWGCRVALPDTSDHRTWAEIRQIIAGGGLSGEARHYAERTFGLLAETEGKVHGIPAEQVHFHEVGALDSILDICLCAELFARLAPARFVCGPLPICDGIVKCEHGLLPVPAPAVFELLQGVPVRGIPSEGETVRPTAIALLKGIDAEFGAWPEMIINRSALVYGGRIIPGVPNGALFASGTANGAVAS